uniref:F-box domain-containing protein n=1 Tax=Oryza barthii TaxID=65489 RepID=A0A0D3ELN9_9ORYZ
MAEKSTEFCQSLTSASTAWPCEDRLSALPDDILLEILQRLADDLRSVVRASALSRRWRHLPHMLPDIRLHARDFTQPDIGAGGRHNNAAGYTVDQTMAAYATARWLLEPTITTPQRVTKKSIDLAFFLRDPYLHSIGRAVGHAIDGGGGTEELDLTVEADIAIADLTDEHKVSLGRRFWSFFQACPVVFRWLTRLTVDDCLSGPDDIPTLVNTCGRLRFLELRHCDVVDDAVLEIDAPRSQLVCLKLHHCNFRRVDLIRVPKLRRVYCDTWIGDNPPVRFGYVPCLDNIAFGSECLFWHEPFVLSQWLSGARSLSISYLNFRGQKIWVKPEDPKLLSPIFGNLRNVHLRNIFNGCDLNWTLFLLDAAPSLNSMYISLCRHTCEACECEYGAEKTNVTRKTSDFKHHNLSLLEMKGFEVEKRVMQYLGLSQEEQIGFNKMKKKKKAKSSQDSPCIGASAPTVLTAAASPLAVALRTANSSRLMKLSPSVAVWPRLSSREIRPLPRGQPPPTESAPLRTAATFSISTSFSATALHRRLESLAAPGPHADNRRGRQIHALAGDDAALRRHTATDNAAAVVGWRRDVGTEGRRPPPCVAVAARICLLGKDPCMECDNVNKHRSLPPIKRRFIDETQKSLIRARLKNGLSTSVEISIG